MYHKTFLLSHELQRANMANVKSQAKFRDICAKGNFGEIACNVSRGSGKKRLQVKKVCWTSSRPSAATCLKMKGPTENVSRTARQHQTSMKLYFLCLVLKLAHLWRIILLGLMYILYKDGEIVT